MPTIPDGWRSKRGVVTTVTSGPSVSLAASLYKTYAALETSEIAPGAATLQSDTIAYYIALVYKTSTMSVYYGKSARQPFIIRAHHAEQLAWMHEYGASPDEAAIASYAGRLKAGSDADHLKDVYGTAPDQIAKAITDTSHFYRQFAGLHDTAPVTLIGFGVSPNSQSDRLHRVVRKSRRM